jgi:hypothetical protein
MHAEAEVIARQLADPDVIQAVSENYIVWASDIGSVEGLRAATQLHLPAFPAFAIVANTTEGTGRLATRSGLESRSPLGPWLRDTAAGFGASLALLRSERSAADGERRLREEQEREYAASLQRDRETAQRARAEAEAAQRAAAQAAAAAAAIVAEREARIQLVCFCYVSCRLSRGQI